MSSGAVEQIISSEKGLASWRKQCRFESRRRCHRVCIIRYRQKYPLTIRKEIKKNCYASFMWLYKHDHQWLECNLPPPTKVKKITAVKLRMPKFYYGINFKFNPLPSQHESHIDP
ncbi:TnsD family Tn7-like transposition protein [Photobacterium leiognathi]|uniref:TnsD family Tn7-like transposition protein n=1 Tax=Photobacterium leiognathi TaxID=553611 RepID=UPI00387F6AAE